MDLDRRTGRRRGYAAPSSGRRVGSAHGARESREPVGAGWEDDVASARDERGTGGGVGVTERAISHERLDSTPLAAGCDSGAHLSVRFVSARTVGWSLVEDSPSAEDGGAGLAAFGAGAVFDVADPLEDDGCEGRRGQIFETGWTGE